MLIPCADHIWIIIITIIIIFQEDDGNTLVFHCAIVADPPPMITWWGFDVDGKDDDWSNEWLVKWQQMWLSIWGFVLYWYCEYEKMNADTFHGDDISWTKKW